MDFYFGQDIDDPDTPSTYVLIQEGKQVFWITEDSSEEEDVSHEAFVYCIRNNPVEFDIGSLTLYYVSKGVLTLTFQGDFKVNGEVKDLEYVRVDSPYTFAEREPDRIEISLEGHRLDFDNMERNI